MHAVTSTVMEETSFNSVRCATSNLQTTSTNTNPVSRSHGSLQQNHKVTGKIYTVSKLATLQSEKIKDQGIKIYDARSINTIRITSSHKPDVTFLKIHLSKSKPSATEKSLNIESLRDTNNLKLYRHKKEEYISHYNLPETPHDKWNNIVSATINATKKL